MIFIAFIVGFIAGWIIRDGWIGWIVNEKLEKGIKALNPWTWRNKD